MKQITKINFTNFIFKFPSMMRKKFESNFISNGHTNSDDEIMFFLIVAQRNLYFV